MKLINLSNIANEFILLANRFFLFRKSSLQKKPEKDEYPPTIRQNLFQKAFGTTKAFRN